MKIGLTTTGDNLREAFIQTPPKGMSELGLLAKDRPISSIDEWASLSIATTPDVAKASFQTVLNEILQEIESKRTTTSLDPVFVPFVIEGKKLLIAVPFDQVQSDGGLLYAMISSGGVTPSKSAAHFNMPALIFVPRKPS